jgi:hypothetical protein
MPFTEHDNMVKTIPSDRTDQPVASENSGRAQGEVMPQY